jgi:hypothetical protein
MYVREEGFAPRSFAHRITKNDLQTIPGWAQAEETRKEKEQRVSRDSQLRADLIVVPHDASSIPEALLAATPPRNQRGEFASTERKLFVKPGAYAWRGISLVPPNLTLHAFAAASDASVKLGRRSVSGGVSCNGRWLMEPRSQGSLLNITLTHGGEAQGGGGNLGKGGGRGGTKGEERGGVWSANGGGEEGGLGGRSRTVVTVFGSPWLIENCDVVLGCGRGRGGGGGER